MQGFGDQKGVGMADDLWRDLSSGDRIFGGDADRGFGTATDAIGCQWTLVVTITAGLGRSGFE